MRAHYSVLHLCDDPSLGSSRRMLLEKARWQVTDQTSSDFLTHGASMDLNALLVCQSVPASIAHLAVAEMVAREVPVIRCSFPSQMQSLGETVLLPTPVFPQTLLAACLMLLPKLAAAESGPVPLAHPPAHLLPRMLHTSN